MRYFPHSDETLKSMLAEVNKTSLNQLFSSIADGDRCTAPLNLPPALDELQMKRKMFGLLAPNPSIKFLGAGAAEHFVPEWVSQQLLRSEWYTSYTPYQPEASQGTLQVIFEFQSIVSSLLGLGVANASMYDGATALVEALLMAVRVTQRKTVILSAGIHPEYRATVQTYLTKAGIRVVETDFDQTGLTNLNLVQKVIDEEEVAAIAIQTPNFFGLLENMEDFAQLAHSKQALLVGVSTECLAFGAIPSLGTVGVDIAVAEGLGFLGGLNLGGPGLGLFACHKSLLRQMPGRLVGQCTDKFNKPGFTLTLSTREQHIRRERATSNICTNHNMMALAFTMSLCAYGEAGFRNLAHKNIAKTLHFRKLLREQKVEIAFHPSHFNETVVCFNSSKELDEKYDLAKQHGIIAGVKLASLYPRLDRHLLICTTEMHEHTHMEQLSHILGRIAA